MKHLKLYEAYVVHDNYKEIFNDPVVKDLIDLSLELFDIGLMLRISIRANYKINSKIGLKTENFILGSVYYAHDEIRFLRSGELTKSFFNKLLKYNLIYRYTYSSHNNKLLFDVDVCEENKKEIEEIDYRIHMMHPDKNIIVDI